MKSPIIECVPNFSEGRDPLIINAIVESIKSVEKVKLLHVDPGQATNRTVVTFAGPPEEVCEAAFRAACKAAELIDMRKHKGAHPRMGATDVLPLIPIADITLEETAELARKLGKRLAEEANIPVYAYEASAFRPERKNLAICRKGEYENLEKRFADPNERPDFWTGGYTESVAHTGATAVGARNFLIAVNYNLNTTSTRRANAIAFDVREKGRPAREGNTLTGKILKDEKGNTIHTPGTLKGTKAIGWFIDEYGIAQVSMNITDVDQTPLHVAFEEVCKKAADRGIRVTGTEIVGMVPKKVMLDAGRHFLTQQERSLGIPEKEIIRIAAQTMGLNELSPWIAEERVIEYLLEEKHERKPLTQLTVKEFVEETASESPAPGGGSVSALMGAMGASLATMVANLSAHKRGWDDRWEYFSDIAVKGQTLMNRLLSLVDEDTEAFNRVMACFQMPKSTPEEKAAYRKALDDATLFAAEVPFQTMQTAFDVLPLLEAMKENGNPNSASDVEVGFASIRSAVEGAYRNVMINVSSLENKEMAEKLIEKAKHLLSETNRIVQEATK